MPSPKITVADDGNQLSLSAGKSGSATFVYGKARFMISVLTESARAETAEWLDEEAGVGDDEDGDDVAWLTKIEVTQTKRARGIGTALLQRGMRELEKRHVGLVFLHAAADLGYEAQLDAFYTNQGFGMMGELDGRDFYYAYLG